MKENGEPIMQFIIMMTLFIITTAIFNVWSIPIWVAIAIFKGINEYILEPRERRKRFGDRD